MEDKIIISKEEFEEYQKFKSFMERNDWESVENMENTLDKCQEVLYERLQQASKKTAERFYDKVNENICVFKIENKSQEFANGYAQAIADICGRIDQVAKQFDIEIKE